MEEFSDEESISFSQSLLSEEEKSVVKPSNSRKTRKFSIADSDYANDEFEAFSPDKSRDEQVPFGIKLPGLDKQNSQFQEESLDSSIESTAATFDKAPVELKKRAVASNAQLDDASEFRTTALDSPTDALDSPAGQVNSSVGRKSFQDSEESPDRYRQESSERLELSPKRKALDLKEMDENDVNQGIGKMEQQFAAKVVVQESKQVNDTSPVKRSKKASGFRIDHESNEEAASPPKFQPKLMPAAPFAMNPASDVKEESTKMEGSVFQGQVGSGVLVEGWLRQKQRKGMKGMKAWHDRYFVLYAVYGEVRYYVDVVQSAWGPIPLSEIGDIPLQLIQKITTPSHPKYKGCRFDITCKASDSDANSDGSRPARTFCLLADSPQTRATWVSMLDSLLKRSDSSPRKVNVPAANSTEPAALPTHSPRQSLTTKSSQLLIVDEGKDALPVAIKLAIDYLETSNPGIEMKDFYAKEASVVQQESALRTLNEYATTSSAKLPNGKELDDILDPIVAGSIVKLWLKTSEHAIMPLQMHDEFLSVADYADQDPYDQVRNLKGLIKALPKRNRKIMEGIIMHLAGVAEYATENNLNSKVLGDIFGSLLFRFGIQNNDAIEQQQDAAIVTHCLIANAESIF